MGLSVSAIVVLVLGIFILYGGILYFVMIIDDIHLIDYLPFSHDRLENLIQANMKIKAIFAVFLVVLILVPVWAASVDVGLIKGGDGRLYKYSITFEESDEVIETINEYTDEGQTYEGNISINQTNITKILFSLTWDESGQEATQDDEFRLTIFALEEISAYVSEANYTPSSSEQSTSGEISIEVQLNNLPNNVTTIWADSSDEVIEMFTSVFGIGNWEFEVEAVDCPPDAIFYDPDTGNDWTLEVTVYYYEGTVEEIKGTREILV